MNPDQTAPQEQSDLISYCLQYALPKNISRREETTTNVMGYYPALSVPRRTSRVSCVLCCSCVFCHFRIWCPGSSVTGSGCIDS